MPSSIPPCFAPNEHQSKAHSHSGTDHRLYTRKAMQLKATYFWTGKYFLCHCLVEENVSERKKKKNQSGKEQFAEKNPRHVTSGRADFLGRVTSRLLLGLPFLTARPLCLLTGSRHSLDGSRRKDQGGILVWPDTWHRSVSKWTQPRRDR